MEANATGLRYSADEHSRLARRYRWRKYRTAYFFLLPSFFFLILVLVIPSVWVVLLSFAKGQLLDPPQFFTLANWQTMFSEEEAGQAIRNTFIFAVALAPLYFVIAIGLALALQRLGRGSAFFRTVIYLPVLTPYVFAALIWLFVIDPDFGIINVLIGKTGISAVNWLGPTLALPTIVILETWHGFGYWTLIFLAGIVSLPQELYQAARIDGARAFAQFRHLTLPLLRPVLVFALVMMTIWNIGVFDSIMVLTTGGPSHTTESMAVYLYLQTFQFFNAGRGAAMSVVMLCIIMTLTVIELRLLRRSW